MGDLKLVGQQTRNQTVMSGLLDLETSIKPGVFRGVRPRLFASVRGVSVVNLWSVPERCWKPLYRKLDFRHHLSPTRWRAAY